MKLKYLKLDLPTHCDMLNAVTQLAGHKISFSKRLILTDKLLEVITQALEDK